MTIQDAGHTYELANVDGGTQVLQFIRKAPKSPEDPTLETMINGTTNEEVLATLIDRLTYLHEQLPDEHTAAAKRYLQSALTLLEQRTASRTERGVEGTNQP